MGLACELGQNECFVLRSQAKGHVSSVCVISSSVCLLNNDISNKESPMCKWWGECLPLAYLWWTSNQCLQGLHIPPASLQVKQVFLQCCFVLVRLVVQPRSLSSFHSQKSLLMGDNQNIAGRLASKYVNIQALNQQIILHHHIHVVRLIISNCNCYWDNQ